MTTNGEDVLDLISGAPYAFSAQVIGVKNDRMLLCMQFDGLQFRSN